MDYRDDNVLKILLSYAYNDENIRAVLMEGSRAFGKVDQYSTTILYMLICALNMLMEKYNTLAATIADALGYMYNFSEAEKTMVLIKGWQR